MSTISVPSPLLQARNTTLYCYTDDNLFPSIKSLLGDSSISEELLSPLSRVTFQVCFLYHCRIQEVLNVCLSDIVHPDRVVVRGIKRSGSYIIYLPGISGQVAAVEGNHKKIPVFPVTYIKLYRDAVRVGIHFRTKNGKNIKRLHASRFALCQSIPVDVSDSELSSIMRHKSLSSLRFYKS